MIKKYKKDRFVLIKCGNDPTLIEKLANKFVIFPLDPDRKVKVHKYMPGQKVNNLIEVHYENIDLMPKLVSHLRNYYTAYTFQITHVIGNRCQIICTSDGNMSVEIICDFIKSVSDEF